ncbi:hypothetical protein BgiMline_002319 [Biomphalaria glabrata]|nr:hypothetical protein BgiMline_002190 [Biomphalaria glabrata]
MPELKRGQYFLNGKQCLLEFKTVQETQDEDEMDEDEMDEDEMDEDEMDEDEMDEDEMDEDEISFKRWSPSKHRERPAHSEERKCFQ